VWDPWAVATAAVAVSCLATAGAAAWRGGAAPATALRGAGLGLAAWLFSLFAWLAIQIVLGGRLGPAAEALVGALAGGAVGWAAWRAARHPRRRWLLGGAALAAAAGAMVFALFTGPRDLSRYPPPTTSPYRLPWTPGVTRLCVQGNRAVVSHRGWDELAYDFAMPVGSEVRAARAGVVVRVVVEHDGHGLHSPNNFISVDHGDGTFGWYFHLQQGASLVVPGQRVRQGQRLAASGNVGLSMLPHVHFHVTDAAGDMLPVTFADVGADGGIPRMFKRYTSGNPPADAEPPRGAVVLGHLFGREVGP
jgi:hypothetical protein